MALLVKIFTAILSILFIVGESAILYCFWLVVKSYKRSDPKGIYGPDEQDLGIGMIFLSASLLIAIAWFVLCAKIYL